MATFITAVLVFGVMIFAHELGHFAMAKRVGIRVEEFSIGMGPKLAGIRRGETNYSLRLIPFGGYVKMAGMESGEEQDERSFNRKSVAQRMGVIFAGPLMNFILAIVLFIFIFSVLGVPTASDEPVIGEVIKGKPAATVGLRPGDLIRAVNGRQVTNWSEIVQTIHKMPRQQVIITVERAKRELKLKVVPEFDPEARVGLIGIKPKVAWSRLGLFASIKNGVVQAVGFTALIIKMLILMIIGKAPAEVGGPVMIVREINVALKFGLAYVLNLAAILSINLGIINLFPIPALDGSRLLFLVVEAFRGRPLDPERENFIHLVGFALLIMLMIVITYKDILKLLG